MIYVLRRCKLVESMRKENDDMVVKLKRNVLDAERLTENVAAFETEEEMRDRYVEGLSE